MSLRRTAILTARTALLALFVAIGGFALQTSSGGGPLSRASGAAPHAGLDGIYDRFSGGYAALDADQVAELYTEQALYLAPGAEIGHGRDAVRASMDRYFDDVRSEDGRLSIRFHVLDRQVAGKLATDVGTYTLERTADGATRRYRGKFVVVFVRGDDGSWRLHADSFSRIDPPDAPAG